MSGIAQRAKRKSRNCGIACLYHRMVVTNTHAKTESFSSEPKEPRTLADRRRSEVIFRGEGAHLGERRGEGFRGVAQSRGGRLDPPGESYLIPEWNLIRGNPPSGM